MRLFVIVVVSSLYCLGVTAQEIRLKRTPILDKLFSNQKSISDITEYPNYWNSENLITEKRIFKPNKLFPKLVVNDSGFYLLINAGGFVYKAVEKEKDSIRFVAVDSTFYIGYNGSAIKFSFKNELYSLGGYGFWKNNGYLLHFKTGKDWQIKTLNIEIPVILKIHAFNNKKGLLYYFSSRYENQATGEICNQQKFYELDIEKQWNKELGLLNDYYANLLSTQLLINVPALNAVLVEDRFIIYLVSIAENKVYKLKNNEVIDRFKYGLFNASNGYAFSEGDYLFYGSSKGSSVDSIKLSISDFELVGEPLYFKKKIWENISFEYKLLIGIVFLILTGIAYFVFYIKNFKHSSVFSENAESFDLEDADLPETLEKSTSYSFTDFEKLIVKKMLEKAGYFNVNEINELLGLKKKTPDFQKKIRTESINRINLKYRKVSGTISDLIVRVRSTDDKRFILYNIPLDADTVMKIIDQND